MDSLKDKKTYEIRDIISYRNIEWEGSEDFFYLREIPSRFEPDFVSPGYYCLGMITQGLLKININNSEYEVAGNAFMVYRPYEPFKVISVESGTVGVMLLFKKDFLDFLIENIFSVRNRSFLSYGMSNLILLSDKDLEKLRYLFTSVFSLLERLSKASWELIARNLSSALLLETDNIISRYIADETSDNVEERTMVSDLIALVAIHFRERKSISFYADALGISERTLNRSLKKHLNITPGALINQRLLSEARHLVSNSNRNIGEVGYFLGFNDPFAFSKFFKKNTGFSPKDFRKVQPMT